ncbi:MAG TPA: helix-turn-helix transcriptional regulator [Solirubrobacterales bacterium]|jgi:transcriptional regulator with XRE-family HTH domain|nr:helix-turn-helix transcriptional regulator [Solirubrobacterales bacterium]
MKQRDEAAAKQVGRNLFLARRRADLSQEKLAKLCGLHRTEISLVEQGRRIPRVDTLVKLASSLEVDVEELLKGIAWVVPASERPGQFDIRRPLGKGGGNACQ